MSAPRTASQRTAVDAAEPRGSASAALAAAVLGFFVITLDALVVNVALPNVRDDLGGGMTGLQWVVDGYTLMFAALLLSAGSFSDRIGARRAFGTGLTVFVAASAACGLAPNLAVLVAARLVQGAGAAMMMPSSLTLIREAYPDPVKRGRAIAWWTISGSVAAAAGPVAGGALSLASWRMIFFINLPVGVVALFLLARAACSPHREVPFDRIGQITAVVAMGGLTFGAIEAGADGFGAPKVLVALAAAALALAVFVAAQARGKHPMVPPDLFRSRSMLIASGSGFAFMAGLTGTVFVYSLYLQQERGLSSLAAGLVFLPMTALSAFLGVPTARLTERFGPRVPIVGGLFLMGVSLTVLTALPASAPAWLVAIVMIPVGICGPLAMQPTTALLLDSVPAHRAGVASGVFNTSRQVGGALAVAVFGALLVHHTQLLHGLRESLVIAAVVVFLAAAANLLLEPTPRLK
ncbi:MFS transporter [Streptomyces sp. NPDC051105]|uniref:MFS transporter n=1 Tax=Streptomyces sp. NPDC051105 TaxID=3154843 RepID=UPI003414D250